MKKNLIYSAIAALLTLGSCATDDLPKFPAGDGNVNFTVTLDNATATRAILGDGTSATTLKYAVYSKTDYNSKPEYKYLMDGNTTFPNGGLTTTVSLDLPAGQDYRVVFFASNPASGAYIFNPKDKELKVNYGQSNPISTFGKDLDCFYGTTDVTVADQVANQSVTLNRPVAQINIGTSDLNNALIASIYGNASYDVNGNVTGYEDPKANLRTKLTATAHNTLDLIEGTVKEGLDEYFTTFTTTAVKPIPDSFGAFPVEGQEYLYCIYLLAPSESTLIDLTADFCRTTTVKRTREFTNIPIQRNYRTNIYGKLLSKTVDFEVTKDPIMGDIDVEIWDGTPGTLPTAVDGVISINTASQLAALAAAVNAGNSMAGTTIKLTRDINLSNKNWTPIGTTGKPFNGNFDGQGHTISNLYISLAGKTSAPSGLFGYVWQGGTTFKNLTLDGVNINTRNGNGKASTTGALIGSANLGTVENVTVKNVNIKAYRQAGGICGMSYGNFKNCLVENADINLTLEPVGNGVYNNGDKAGGLVGLSGEDPHSSTGNYVKNVKITGYRDLGGMFGYQRKDTYSNNTVENVEIFVTLENADKHEVEGGSVAQPGNFGAIGGRLTDNIDGGNNVVNGYTLYEPTRNIANTTDLNAAINKGGFVQIASDANITLTANLAITKPTIINVPANATLTLGSQRISNSSDLTLSGNGNIEGNSFLVTNANGSHLTIDGGNYTTTTDNAYATAIHTEGDLVINGGNFKAGNAGALTCNFVNGNKGTVKINGGTFTNSIEGSYAVTVNGAGNVEFNDGIFIGNFGCLRVESSAWYANVVINGGTFLCTDKFYALGLDMNSSSSGSTVTVNGGKFWGANNTLYCKSGSNLIIKGGIFRSLSNYPVADGYKSSTISQSETVTGNGETVNALYNVKVSK